MVTCYHSLFLTSDLCNLCRLNVWLFPFIYQFAEGNCIILVIKLSLLWPLRAFINWLSPFSRTSGVLASFLAFQYDKVLLAHLIYFLPQIYNQALLWGPLVPLSSKLNIPVFNSFKVVVLYLVSQKRILLYIGHLYCLSWCGTFSYAL